jgi:hypothetical protein
LNSFMCRLRSDLQREAWRAAHTIPALAGALPARLLVSIIACGTQYTIVRVAPASVASRMVWYTTVRNLRL